MYHLSDRYLGASAIIAPRIPRDPMRGEDAVIPRICVAPTLEGCLIALRGCWYNTGRWFVYVPENVQPAEPHRVPDAACTGELWILTSARFRLEGRVLGSL